MIRPLALPEISPEALGQRFSAVSGDRPFPLSGQWELTCRCNLACLMCYTDCFNTPERIRRELSFEEIARLMDQVAAAGCLELTLTGGEPLARPDFLEIYAYAKEKGFLVTVFTNGTLITAKVADFWKSHPPAMIEISFHGASEESFEGITLGRGSFGRCLNGIKLIRERGLPLKLKTTAMTVNRDEILPIKDYARSLGARYTMGSDIRPRLDGSEDVYGYQLAAGEVSAIERSDAEFCAERERQDAARPAAPNCGGGRRKFHIDAYGGLQLCSKNRRKSYDLRSGSFAEGFSRVLPEFPCPARA